MTHIFSGKWITDSEFCDLEPRNVFHKQLQEVDLPCTKHRNRHILFRKTFEISKLAEKTKIFISADDYYKLYINGRFVCQGPAPAYHFRYRYNEFDITPFLKEGKNTVAVHTLYQGLINRVWQSGDLRHGLILDIECGEEIILSSDESFKCAAHTAYRETGTVGYDTQFLEEYDSRADEVGFFLEDFDDSNWETARIKKYMDYNLTKQKSETLVFEKIKPVLKSEKKDKIIFDFGSNYVGYLVIKAKGINGDKVVVRCGQELTDDGNVRYNLRANCNYEEEWILSGGEDMLDWFDYKAFRFAEIILPLGAEISDIYLNARHYPFKEATSLKKEFSENEKLRSIWNLCVNTQKYGVQEAIYDCMDREKGFYVGDGCYTALVNMVLTGDDSIVRMLIDDAFAASFITEGLVTCLNCSFMQEIGEYPLMLIYLVLWHYKLKGDKEYLKENYPKVVSLLESYRRDYEKDFILSDIDKWCVVEWPDNFQDGYDVDIKEGKVCREPHVSLNAYYIEAVRCANKIAEILGEDKYRDEAPLLSAFYDMFYVKEKHLFKDGRDTDHISIVGNMFPFGLGLCPDEQCQREILKMLRERKISTLSLFTSFLALEGLVKMGDEEEIKNQLLDEGAWLRMLREDATTTFEGWGRDSKWNTSLFHMTFSYALLFMADIDLKELFCQDDKSEN